MADYAKLQRVTVSAEDGLEIAVVDDIAEQLRSHLHDRLDAINLLNIHGAASSAIQNEVAVLLEQKLGFGSEVVLTPDLGLVTRARPDFFFELAPGRGVIAEVERGGVTANNHDLKDLWKAHIAPNVQHLFLVVPEKLYNESGGVRERPFPRVVRRLGAFFGVERREVDVLSAHVFGY